MSGPCASNATGLCKDCTVVDRSSQQCMSSCGATHSNPTQYRRCMRRAGPTRYSRHQLRNDRFFAVDRFVVNNYWFYFCDQHAKFIVGANRRSWSYWDYFPAWMQPAEPTRFRPKVPRQTLVDRNKPLPSNLSRLPDGRVYEAPPIRYSFPSVPVHKPQTKPAPKGAYIGDQFFPNAPSHSLR